MERASRAMAIIIITTTMAARSRSFRPAVSASWSGPLPSPSGISRSGAPAQHRTRSPRGVYTAMKDWERTTINRRVRRARRKSGTRICVLCGLCGQPCFS